MGGNLNSGCVPSKALLHIAKQIHQAKVSSRFGFEIIKETDLEKGKGYIQEKQNSIRSHENVNYFRKKGLNVVLGIVSFVFWKKIEVDGKVIEGRKIVIVTGSYPRKIQILAYKDQYIFGSFSRHHDEPSGEIFMTIPSANGLWFFDEIEIGDKEDIGHFLKGFGEDLNGEIYLTVSDVMGPTGKSVKLLKLTNN